MNVLQQQSTFSHHVKLTPVDNMRLASLCGQCDEHLRQIESHFNIIINNRGNEFNIRGEKRSVTNASKVLDKLYQETAETQKPLTPTHINLVLNEFKNAASENKHSLNEALHMSKNTSIKTPLGIIKPRGQNQQHYVENIRSYPISIGIGPAGTGKTYLGVACAVEALEKSTVRRIVLVRPAVEAGEKLGFLPGDISQKIDPYLRPIYDALFETLGFEQVNKLIEKNIIEIAPLAYMRGRTLNDSFIILDEAQNTTPEQMKMFLTRLGFGSTAVVTGDITQNDLPKGRQSGLHHSINVLKNIPEIKFTHFTAKDVVRHPLVQSIVQAYQKHSDPKD